MSWAGDYVGRQFVDGEWDCWRLVVDVYKEQLRIQLNWYGTITAKDLQAIANRMKNHSQVDPWRLVKVPREFDVAMLTGRIKSVGRVPMHVGVMVDAKRLLHVEERADSVITQISHPLIRSRVIGYYRHKENI